MELSRDKRDLRDGALGSYLEELREGQKDDETSSGRQLEKWFLSDWLKGSASRKPAALPFLPKAKFNSGDNPILAAAALIMGTGVLLTLLGWT